MGVKEHYVSSARVTANAAWAVTAVLLVVGWTEAIAGAGHWEVAIMLATSACISAGVAAVMQVRIYAARMCALIRRAHPVVEPVGENLRVMR